MASAYTTEQIDRYLRYISLPSKYELKINPPRDLAFLTELHTQQLCKIPYENLSLHYSAARQISLDPVSLFQKLVVDNRGRGGYCMENNIFFNHILRGLGFAAYFVGARVRMRVNGVPQGDYLGWVHIVNIVTLANGTKYVVDVSFGGDGPVAPMPLVHNEPQLNLGTQEVRLVHDFIPGQVCPDEDQKLWIYEYRNAPNMLWNGMYAFPTIEFLQADFEISNYWASTSPACFQTFTVLIVKFLKDDIEEERITGKVMLVNGDVKMNVGGKTSVVKVCKTEGERLEALKEFFGIRLTEEEAEGIQGHISEL